MVYWLLALWEAILPERSEKDWNHSMFTEQWIKVFPDEVGAYCVRGKNINLRMPAFTEREQAARIEQRRRQWDLEASQSIKE